MCRMDHMSYGEKQASRRGKDLRSVLLHVMPDLSGQLPLAARAWRSSERLEGAIGVEPLCLALSGLVVADIV